MPEPISDSPPTASPDTPGAVRASSPSGKSGKSGKSGGSGKGGSGGAPGPAVTWTVTAILLLFGRAVWSLGGRGVETVRSGLGPWEWGALILLTVLFVWGEGFRALQRRWVPFVLDRARRLEGRGLFPGLLAPLYAMGLVGKPRRTLVRAWAGSVAIVGAVLLVRAAPEPWRGIVDLSVAAALVWGMGALLLAFLRGPPASPTPGPRPGTS